MTPARRIAGAAAPSSRATREATGRGFARLRDQLRAVAAAQPEERRGAEQVGPGHAVGDLAEQPLSGRVASGPEATTRTRWRNGG